MDGTIGSGGGDQPVAGALDRRVYLGGVAACSAAVGAFLLVVRSDWRPHEDETLALFIGREPLGRFFEIVLGQRGGAPLHFMLAWAVAHLGGGLSTMRLFSALFATASVPVIAALGTRLAGRGVGLAACVLAAGSWLLLFYGVFARMYSLFLFLSALSYLALLRALERGGVRSWLAWGASIVLTIAAHQYGALVLGSQALYVLVTRARLRHALPAFAGVVVVAAPLWWSSAVLASRFDVGIGGGGATFHGPGAVFAYLWHTAGDASSGSTPVLVAVLVLAAIGLLALARDHPHSAVLACCVGITPTLFFLAGRFGSSASPQTRHLIFALPFLAIAVAAGMFALGRLAGRRSVWVVAILVAALVPEEVAWAMHRTPALFRGENPVRIAARARAATWLAATSRPSDVLFAFDPVFLAAWERNRSAVSRTVVPRADPALMLDALKQARKPLGRGVWVFDAGDLNNAVRRTTIPFRLPSPRGEFEGRVYGPYLIIRTRGPTRTVARFLEDSRRVELVGTSLGMGAADVNYAAVRTAQLRWARRSRSSVSS